ncbi:hypothetical protein EI94DRAFT_1715629 [Lactarius quietus]|nr:hypothetical protein EI94DRAFT_1715629 [Lactarius quietus]
MANQLLIIYFQVILTSLSQYGTAQQILFPAAIPLAVRSPYLNCWDQTTNGMILGNTWSTNPNSNQSQILGWAVFVRIDELTYSFLGDEPLTSMNPVNVTDMVITPTQTVVAAQAGPMQVNLTFLNPIEPRDWIKQSIPFSYLAFSAQSLDGAAHNVQVYSDVSGEWNSGDHSQVIHWSTASTNNIFYHMVRLQNPVLFEEINNQAEWGSFYYAIGSADNITLEIAQGSNSRQSFIQNGVLNNQTVSTSGSISQDSNFVVFAISRNLDLIHATEDPVVWAVGLTTNPAISYTGVSGASPQQRSLYYKNHYHDTDDTLLIVDFLNNFANASSSAQQLDQKILQGAASVSDLLGDLVSLATAQIYGSTQLTIGIDSNGNYNTSDVMMFMKNIGGLEANRVNAVETLYSAFPAFMYIDPTLGGPLLEPLFQLQATPNYTVPFAAADLGSTYPNVTISNSHHKQGVEQSGNMLIMTYAYARASGDGSLISKYYSLLTSWADYLSSSTLLIHEQSSADALTTNNQTNLAIKGIIAIKAMSKMSTVVEQTADAEKYNNTAASLYNQWKSLALASDQHLLVAYGQEGSWTLGYNLFADVWLDTGVVESSVFEGQGGFIDNVTLSSNFSNFGMPIDSLSEDISVSSWNLFVAAMTSNQDLRTNIISRVHNRASFNVSAGAFPLSYDSTLGSTLQGVASPAQGAMYAPLALTAPVVQIKANFPQTPSSKTSQTSAIAAGVVGGVAALILVAGSIAFMRRRQRQGDHCKSVGSYFPGTGTDNGPNAPIAVTPFNATPAAPLEAGTTNDGLFSTSEPMLSPSQGTVPVPVGLTGKELARLRSECVPLLSPPSHAQSSPSMPQPMHLPTISATDQTMVTPTPDTSQRLQTEVESLRREMQQLRAERFELPPSYPPSYGDEGE